MLFILHLYGILVSLDSEFTPTESNNSSACDSKKNQNNLENININVKLPSSEALQRLQSPESSTESDEICKIFRDKDKINFVINCEDELDSINNNNNSNTSTNSNNQNNNNNSAIIINNENNANLEECEEDCSFVYYEEEPASASEEDDDLLGQSSLNSSIFNDISFSNCEFDVQTFRKFLKDDDHQCNSSNSEQDEDDDDDEAKSDESDFFCDCLVEAVPLYHTKSENNIMRETGAGKLRGLLKAPNRPAPTRKNRVVFDETRNEFFEADYIILIREDCPYDEEDEEPCTCGDHELVRICCDEGCSCGYTDAANDDDGRTPPVSKIENYFIVLNILSRKKSQIQFNTKKIQSGNCSHDDYSLETAAKSAPLKKLFSLF